MKESVVNTNINEKKEKSTKYTFSILRPGGNDTALVMGIENNPDKRKKINDEIMLQNPNVEQVGFVNLDEKLTELYMAGGEFCGNATRSAAWLALDGIEGELEIQVSGVERLLKAGVDAEGNAWAQMPVKSNFESVRELNEITSIVELDGITQVVTYEPLPPNTTREEIKQRAREILERLGLIDTVPASGVMFVSLENDTLKIEPVVWVRDIQTLFYETACGSGTTAVGLQLAKKLQSNVDVDVFQPSGLPIRISIEVGDGFEYAQISGPVLSLK